MRGMLFSISHFRSAPFFQHEVNIDDEQFAWFEKTLNDNPQRSIFVFSHTPILKSKLRIIQRVHLLTGNAYLNHSDRPERFMALVEKHPQIKLWFSAHNHLGQYYPDTLSTVGNCAFVHVGTMARITRDGHLHSRLLQYDAEGYTLSTIDHVSNQTHVELRTTYQSNRQEHVPLPKNAILPPPQDDTFPAPLSFDAIAPLFDINNSRFAISHNALIEYDITQREAINLVVRDMTHKTVTVQDDSLHIAYQPPAPEAPVGEDAADTPTPAPIPTEEVIKACPIRKGFYRESAIN